MSRHAPLWLLGAAIGGVALLPGGVHARGGGEFGHSGAEQRLDRLDDAFSTEEYDDIRRLRQRGDILPLEKILEQARRQRHGRVLETGLDQEHGRYIYNIELVDDKGQVWEMELDATTGEVLENRQED